MAASPQRLHPLYTLETRMSITTASPRPGQASRLWAYLTLTRPANVVTALADVLAGAAAAGTSAGLPGLLVATAALYAGGVVLNDVIDADLDARERPERPIPSGRASRTGAGWLGGGLLAAGIIAAFAVSAASGAVAAATAAMILLYDGWAKHHPLAGPVVMGLCRGLNLMLGVSALPTALGAVWSLTLLPVAYVAAITAISRGEVHGGKRGTGWLAVVLLAAVLGSLAGVQAQQGHLLPYGLFFLALLAWRVLPPFVTAARNPQPAAIGGAVRAGVLSLILLDAALAAGFAGPVHGLAVLALWPVSMRLARLFAVT